MHESSRDGELTFSIKYKRSMLHTEREMHYNTEHRHTRIGIEILHSVAWYFTIYNGQQVHDFSPFFYTPC
jgi:hypothetical protein